MTQGTTSRKTLSPGDSDIGQGLMQRKMLSPGKRGQYPERLFCQPIFLKVWGDRLFLPEWCDVSVTEKPIQTKSKGSGQWNVLALCQNTSCYVIVRLQAPGVRLRQESMNDLLRSSRCLSPPRDLLFNLFAGCLSVCTGALGRSEEGGQIPWRQSYGKL